MRNTFDLSPYRRNTVGFDRLFELLESGKPQLADEFPPFDLERDGEDGYRITLAVAGYRRDEIDITTRQNLLVVSGTKKDNQTGGYVHKGIVNRTFERTFALGDYVRVKGADLADGLLQITLRREIPEEMKPRKIAIGDAAPERLEQAGSSAEEGEQVAA